MPVAPVAVAGIAGTILGHIVWLIGMSIARAGSPPSAWVLLFSALYLLGATLAIYEAWRSYHRQEWVRTAFLGGLAASPVLFTIVVLGVTYL